MPGTACAVGPHLERKVFTFGGREAGPQKEGRFASQCEELGQALRARLGDQGREQRAAHPGPLPILVYGEPGQLRQIA